MRLWIRAPPPPIPLSPTHPLKSQTSYTVSLRLLVAEAWGWFKCGGGAFFSGQPSLSWPPPPSPPPSSLCLPPLLCAQALLPGWTLGGLAVLLGLWAWVFGLGRLARVGIGGGLLLLLPRGLLVLLNLELGPSSGEA